MSLSRADQIRTAGGADVMGVWQSIRAFFSIGKSLKHIREQNVEAAENLKQARLTLDGEDKWLLEATVSRPPGDIKLNCTCEMQPPNNAAHR